MPLRGPVAMLGQPTLGIVVDRRLNYEFKWGMGAMLSLEIVFAEGRNVFRLGDIYPCDIYPWRHIPIMGDIYPSWVNVSWVPGQHLPIGDIYP